MAIFAGRTIDPLGGLRGNGHAGSSSSVDAAMEQFVEFTYPGGEKLLSQCRRRKGCWNQVGEHVQCTDGSANISSGKIFDRAGKVIWQSDTPASKGNGLQTQQNHFFAALRSGERPNETDVAAKSTMTALLGRLASQRGRRVRWDDAVACKDGFAAIESLSL